MKTEAIVPAARQLDADGIPFSSAYGDIYHPRAGALAQARHVFLAGNQLPQRWQGRERFTVLETGFGLGNNFLATWQAWRADPGRCERLSFVSVERHPLTRADMAAVRRDADLAGLAESLTTVWPPLTHDLHRLTFDGGQVELLLALGDVQAWLVELLLQADAFFLDGFAPARNPRMWDLRVCKALGRLAAPGATLASWTAARSVRNDLTTAGFDVRLGAGTGGKRDILLGHYAPRFRPPRRPAHRPDTATGERRALIVGAGLAGCATAWALAERGWHSRLIERGPVIAGAASGNPAGIFHGIVHPQDGVHARLSRAAALTVTAAVQRAVSDHGVAGSAAGLLRLETALALPAMRQLLAELGLPGEWVQAVSPAEAAALGGLPTGGPEGPAAPAGPAWFYPSGGWVHPAGLARSYLERAGGRAELGCGLAVESLRRVGAGWQLLDAGGQVIDRAPVLVLANAADAQRLLGPAAWASLRVEARSTRGQISLLPMAAAPAGLTACRLPLAGAGYLLPPHDGQLMFGATSQLGDRDSAVRLDDHAFNLEQLRRLTGLLLSDVDVGQFTGRTAWRWSTADRLPLVGAVPALPGGWPVSDDPAICSERAPTASRLADLRFTAREPGLYLFTALGSHGIVWSALGAQMVAAQISGSPLPLGASLQAAIDPARFRCRALRRSAAQASLPSAGG